MDLKFYKALGVASHLGMTGGRYVCMRMCVRQRFCRIKDKQEAEKIAKTRELII